MKTFITVDIVAFIIVALCTALLVYGLVTDCPKTAGYVYCENHE
jgi:hypothetical protein